jgi:membrane protein implicated in regulation of membrane protease activity
MNYNKWIAGIGFFVVMLSAVPADAYVGPGAGVSLISSLVGVVIAIFVALGAVLAWPLRRYLKKRKESSIEESQEEL